MAFGNFHPLPPKPPKEKFLFNLSLTEAGIMALGVWMAEKIFNIYPYLPINHFIFNKIHVLIPIALAAFLAFGRHPVTNIPIGQEIINWFEFKSRKRVLEYKRGG